MQYGKSFLCTRVVQLGKIKNGGRARICVSSLKSECGWGGRGGTSISAPPAP